MQLHCFCAGIVLLLFRSYVGAITLPESYDVVWTTQSRNSSESMPLGGGGIGLNVWAENGTILFYIAKSGIYDDNNSLVKLGRIRLALDSDTFLSSFSQTLHLNDGYVSFTGRDNATVKLWVDVNYAVIHVEVESTVSVPLTASYENWRDQNRVLGKNGTVWEQDQSSWDQLPSANATERADNTSFQNGGIRMTHRNLDPTAIFDYTVETEGLGRYKDRMYNPIANNTYGLWMFSPQLIQGNITTGFYVNTSYKAWNLRSQEPQTAYSLTITIHQNQTESLEDFENQFSSLNALAINNTQEDTVSWWHEFWDRSYILINEDAGAEDPGFTTGKNYQIFRYMQGCNAGAEWPLRFNGGLFTFDPVFVNNATPYTPDFRRWTGGVFTAQNQRLVYWPLLKSGDFDLMKSQFEFYRRIVDNARLPALTSFGINETLFSEQIESFGLPNIYEWQLAPRTLGFPQAIAFNSYIEWIQDTANEFADMILQASLFTGLDLEPYSEFIQSQLRWFDRFYQQFHSTVDTFSRGASPINETNGDGPLIIYPGSGCETYKGAYNPASTISGLQKLLSDLLQIAPASLLGNVTYWESYLKRVPEIPLRLQNGHLCIAPAQAYARIQNVEIPQLYPVFPWGTYGLGQPTDLNIAINTYLYDTETQLFHGNIGWKQDVIWLTRMGLTANATNLTISRWADSTVYRFPVFKGPNYDWAPDINHYGSASIALQEMLLQTFARSNKQIRLLGAWPDDWTVRFKLLAPERTTVIGDVAVGGNFTILTIIPESRRKDVVFGQS